MDTLLVTGSTGLTALKVLQQATGSYNVVLLGRTPPPAAATGAYQYWQADLRHEAAIDEVMVAARPQVIIHTAAMTDVDLCEREPKEAWEVNVEGTRHLAWAAQSANAHLVFVSTDYVFSGDHGPYREEDATHPRSVYGQSKLAAEQVVRELCPDVCIARTSTLYGAAPGVRSNFVTWLLGQLQEGRPVTVVTDQVSSPTLADNLAEMLLALAAKGASGAYHTVGGQWLSRYEFACVIAECFGLDAGLIRPGASAELGQSAPRPAHSGLITEKVARETGVRPLKVAEALHVFRRQLQEERP